MKTLAEQFLQALSNVDAVAVRDIFMSLGTSDSGAGFVLTFNDHSQALGQWIPTDNDTIHSALMCREQPGERWRLLS
jgi:hypothetical protein